MIPKIIHYCWFGGQPLGDLEKACLESWKGVLSDYQLRLWNESSFDVNHYAFAKAAYQAGKYAFVSDVARLHALYQEGGIYLDTDMLVLKSLDPFLEQEFFTGEYRQGALNAAIIGAKPKSPVIKELLKEYNGLNFDLMRPKTIPEVFDELLWNLDDSSRNIYPSDYFYPLPLDSKSKDFASFLTENSFTVHLWNHSWKDEFVLLKANQFWKSLLLAGSHIYLYPSSYKNRAYLMRYVQAFKTHTKRYLHRLIFPS